MTEPIEPPTNLFHGRQERSAVIFREEDVMPLIASGRDVVQCSSEFYAKRSGHGLSDYVNPISRPKLARPERLCNGRPDPVPLTPYLAYLEPFTHGPSIKSSLKFLRKTPWAREKVEGLYLRSLGSTD